MTHEYWYLSRAAGFTAYTLLFVSVALGISISARMSTRRRNLMFDLHRFTTILALAFTFFHVYILLGDNYFSFSVWQLAIPFASPYRTWQTAAGSVALYALALIVVTFYIRRFIGFRAWRAIHFATFAMFGAVALHGITAGTDTSTVWARLLYISTFCAVAGLIVYRVQYRLPDEPAVRAARFVAAGATIVAILLLVFATGLVIPRGGESALADTAPVDQRGTDHPFLENFASDLAGTYQQAQSESDASLIIDGDLTGELESRLHVELLQTMQVPVPDDESRESEEDDEDAESRPQLTITTNTAELRDPSTLDAICTGALTTLRNGIMRIACTGAGPYQGVEMALSSQIRADDGELSGELSGSMYRDD